MNDTIRELKEFKKVQEEKVESCFKKFQQENAKEGEQFKEVLGKFKRDLKNAENLMGAVRVIFAIV